MKLLLIDKNKYRTYMNKLFEFVVFTSNAAEMILETVNTTITTKSRNGNIIYIWDI